MLSEFYAKTKSLRQSRKLRLWQGEDYVLKEIEVGLSPKLNWWVTRPKKYYVDEEGFIRLKKQNSASPNKKLTKKQWFFNHQTPVPTFNTDDFLQLKRIYETPDLFVGNFFAVVDGKVRKVPIFTSPKIENGSQKPERKAVSGYNFEVVFNDVFWNYTYEEANDYKAYYRKVIEKLESEDKPENAELIARLKRTLFTVKDYRIVHGRMKLDFYTKNVKPKSYHYEKRHAKFKRHRHFFRGHQNSGGFRHRTPATLLPGNGQDSLQQQKTLAET